jgi:hypothetical protein
MEVRTERRWWRGPASPTGRRRRRGRAAYSSRAGRLTRTPFISTELILLFNVADPDPYVFGPPDSRSGSGSCYHQAKVVRKILIPAVKYFLFTFY